MDTDCRDIMLSDNLYLSVFILLKSVKPFLAFNSQTPMKNWERQTEVTCDKDPRADSNTGKQNYWLPLSELNEQPQVPGFLRKTVSYYN